MYHLEVLYDGLALSSKSIEIRSVFPEEDKVQLSFVPLTTTIEVKEGGTLVSFREMPLPLRAAMPSA
jgi:hypothetical protein